MYLYWIPEMIYIDNNYYIWIEAKTKRLLKSNAESSYVPKWSGIALDC